MHTNLMLTIFLQVLKLGKEVRKYDGNLDSETTDHSILAIEKFFDTINLTDLESNTIWKFKAYMESLCVLENLCHQNDKTKDQPSYNIG